MCRNHSFTTEGSLATVMCTVLRFGGMTAREALRLRQLSSEWQCFIDGWFLASVTTPCLQMVHRPQQSSMCQARLAHLLMLAYRSDLTPGVFVRALGPALHGDHRVKSLEANNPLHRKILTPQLYSHLHRVLKIGAPHRLVEHGSWENREAFVAAGNHSSAKKGAKLLDDCANKDERSLHALALPAWVHRFVPHLQCTPMAVLEKEGKNPRPIFDGSSARVWTIFLSTTSPTFPTSGSSHTVQQRRHISAGFGICGLRTRLSLFSSISMM